MAAKRGLNSSKDDGALPASIATEADLEAHLAALTIVEPLFGALWAVAGDVPLRRADPGFGGLAQTIISQQISTAAGKAIFARTEAALGVMSADRLMAVDDAALKGVGLSTPKIRTLRAIASALLDGDLDLDGLTTRDAEDAIAHLSAIKGIGRWTAEVYLLFAHGHSDVFPAGDLALKEGVRLGFGLDERPGEKALYARSQGWRPHRSAAARLVWAYYGAVKRGGAPV